MPRNFAWAIRLTVMAALIVLTPLASLAGTTGKLMGRVLNDKKEPLAGVNVRIDGQRLGAITDDSGNYFIIGIPAGHYTIRMNLVGYGAYSADGVTVSADFTTTLNATMRIEAVELTGVSIDASRPLLQKDATGTTRFITGEEIAKLPTRGYRDAAAQQTGVVNFKRQIDNESQNGNTLIIRGGRPNETAYFVDGFSQQDPLTGTSSTSISNSAIEEVVVLTGGFNAEYGRIMSGAVNVVTKEGADKYFGSIEAISDILAGDWIGSRKTDYNIYDFALGGPILPNRDNLSFYVSSERRWQSDRSPSFLTDQYRDQLSSLGLDSDYKPANNSGGYTFQGKLGWQVNDAMSFKIGGMGSEENWREYSHAYLFNLDHTAKYLDRNKSFTANFNHVVSPKTFYTLGANWFETLRKRGDGVHFDRLGEYYRNPNPRFDPDLPLFFDTGHVFDDYLQRRSSYYGVQGSMTSQVNRYHQLKAGADYQAHTLRLFNHFFPAQLGGSSPNLTDWDGYGYDMVVIRDNLGNITRVDLEEVDDGRDGAKHPKTWSAFVQDKFEREGVIVNGGLRLDHINVDTEALVSETRPLGGPDAIGNLPDSLETVDLTSNKTYARVSPRLGVAFPVDEKTQLRFNYGQFYQQPNLQDLYVSYRFLQHKIRTGGYFVGFGNPNLKPEQTTAYEVGVARQVGDKARVDITAYYKDVKDLVEITNVPSFPNSFSTYRNRDFATIKGVDIGYTTRKVNNVSASINYSLSYANGTGSVSNTQGNIAWTASNPPKQTAPLDFDQRHKLSMNLDWSLGKGQGPSMGGWHPFEDLGLNVLYNVGSGTPYTPTSVYNEITLAATNSSPIGPLNSRYGPWTSNLDLKATRGFQLGGTKFQASLWVLNVLDAENANGVYTGTGSAFSTGWLNTEAGEAFVANTASRNGEGLYNLAQNNPNIYSNPRLVRFGIRANF
jgi:outer membrane receptor protein involved in Fe transport